MNTITCLLGIVSLFASCKLSNNNQNGADNKELAAMLDKYYEERLQLFPIEATVDGAISLIGNFLVAAGDNPVEPSPGAELNEVEIGFSAAIDPYARADIFVSLGEEGAEVEEGYVTFTALPGQLLGKVGRLKAQFGKINTLHPHNLPWPDLPLPITSLLGGEEGWRGDGISVARLLPLGDTFSELTLQAFRGESEGLFTAESRSDLAYNAHYKLFRDLSEAVNLELGLSYGNGPNGLGEGRRTELAGLDATKYRPDSPLPGVGNRRPTQRLFGSILSIPITSSRWQPISATSWGMTTCLL